MTRYSLAVLLVPVCCLALGLLMPAEVESDSRAASLKIEWSEEEIRDWATRVESWFLRAAKLNAGLEPQEWTSTNPRAVETAKSFYYKSGEQILNCISLRGSLHTDPYGLEATMTMYDCVRSIVFFLDGIGDMGRKLGIAYSPHQYTISGFASCAAEGLRLGEELVDHRRAIVQWYDSNAGRPEPRVSSTK